MNRLGAQRDDSILASMYRHLAHWPPYLALAWTLMALLAIHLGAVLRHDVLRRDGIFRRMSPL